MLGTIGRRAAVTVALVLTLAGCKIEEDSTEEPKRAPVCIQWTTPQGGAPVCIAWSS